MGRDIALTVEQWADVWRALDGEEADLAQKLGVDGESGEDVAESLTDSEWSAIYRAVADRRDAIWAGLYGRNPDVSCTRRRLVRILEALAEFSPDSESVNPPAAA